MFDLFLFLLQISLEKNKKNFLPNLNPKKVLEKGYLWPVHPFLLISIIYRIVVRMAILLRGVGVSLMKRANSEI